MTPDPSVNVIDPLYIFKAFALPTFASNTKGGDAPQHNPTRISPSDIQLADARLLGDTLPA